MRLFSQKIFQGSIHNAPTSNDPKMLKTHKLSQELLLAKGLTKYQSMIFNVGFILNVYEIVNHVLFHCDICRLKIYVSMVSAKLRSKIL